MRTPRSDRTGSGPRSRERRRCRRSASCRAPARSSLDLRLTGAEQAQIYEDGGDAETENDHAVRGGEALVVVRRVPAVGLAGEHRQVAAGESEHDGERLEREDRPDDERRLKARPQEREYHVNRAAESARAEELGRLENVAGYDLEARNEDEQDHRRRTPRFRDY